MPESRKVDAKQERRIHYNRLTEHAPENIFSWYFLIVNEPREIERIKQRIYEVLRPSGEPQTFDSRCIQGTNGLQFELFYLESPVSEIERDKIYKGKWCRDRRLYTRKTNLSLLSILEQEDLI